MNRSELQRKGAYGIFSLVVLVILAFLFMFGGEPYRGHRVVFLGDLEGAGDDPVEGEHKEESQDHQATLYILVITTINSFQCFALIQLLTSGGSGTNTVTGR